MRCYICNKVLSDPQFNEDHKDYDPCMECLDVIEATLAKWRDRPSMDEDEFHEEISLSELGPYLPHCAPSAGDEP